MIAVNHIGEATIRTFAIDGTGKFETVIEGEKFDGMRWCSASLEQAKNAHRAAVAMIQDDWLGRGT